MEQEKLQWHHARCTRSYPTIPVTYLRSRQQQRDILNATTSPIIPTKQLRKAGLVSNSHGGPFSFLLNYVLIYTTHLPSCYALSKHKLRSKIGKFAGVQNNVFRSKRESITQKIAHKQNRDIIIHYTRRNTPPQIPLHPFSPLSNVMSTSAFRFPPLLQ